MNKNVAHYYKEFSKDDPSPGHFHKVIALHERKEFTWEEVKEISPSFPRGWFELASLSSQCRLEFLCDFWLSKLPFRLKFSEFIPKFFERIEEVGVYLIQRTFDDPFEEEIVYSFKEDGGFFRGKPPVSEENLLTVQKKFPNILFPEDYINFLQIHDGFSKGIDTGLILHAKVVEVYEGFLAFLAGLDPIFIKEGEAVEPRNLIPFYESFGLHGYQCFYADWYPEQEMGNVYFSGIDHVLSDISNRDLWVENLAFPTFLDWLLFYLKGVDEI